MDGARLSQFPHLSWLGFPFTVTPASDLCHVLHGSCHSINIVFSGHGRVRWLCRGLEVRYDAIPGSVHFLPADGESHTLLAKAAADTRSFTLFLPSGHLNDLAVEDHTPVCGEHRRLFIEDDRVLQVCMARMMQAMFNEDRTADVDADEAARSLVLRLVQLSGGGVPDWHGDTSMLSRRSLADVVAHIDSRLTIPPSASELGVRMGLSPSHFAKKFRQSTGLSLQRFVNRRRLRLALDRLRTESEPIAQVALDLGFSSQSHLTRLFSDLTGMTPAKYRKQFQPTRG